ncbi:MAG: metallophosphoesterase [Clostridia bacterium]|nr:metallophosphoesterase [Clostridia bacterium]
MKKTFLIIFSFILIISAVNFRVFADNEVVVNINAGDTVSGAVEFMAHGMENLQISIDGVSVGAGIGKPYFSFKAEGLEYGGGNVYYGDVSLTSLPSTSGTFKMVFDENILENGDAVLTYIAASGGFSYPELPVYGTYNLDDQSIANVSVILPNGKPVAPSSVILYYPVEGTNQVTEVTEEYDPLKTYNIGDGWNASTNLGGSTPNTPIYVSFVFADLLNEIKNQTGSVAVFDTSTLEDGEHTLTVTCEGENVKEIKFFTDNTGPSINFDFKFGTVIYKDTVFEFSAEDLSGEAKIKADIDGEFYHSGRTLEWISEGRHLLTLTATDKYGNQSTFCTEFVMCDREDSIINESMQVQTSSPVIDGRGEEYTFDIGNSKYFVFKYKGSTSENRSVSVSAFDWEAEQYVQIGTAQSGAETEIRVEDLKYISDGKVKIIVKPDIYVSESNTVVWITDTQYYSNFEDLNNVYELILNYSVDLYKNGKAGYLIHTGDIVDTFIPADKAQSEWKFADKVHEILDNANMPNGVLAGNHDTNNTPADLTYFNRYFGKGRFFRNNWYGGSLDNNSCHYDLVTIGDTDYLFLFISNGIEADERTVAWANAVCKAYPDRSVILCTHSYLDTDGTYVSNLQDVNAYNHSRAKEIMENIIVPNENIVAVLCGHVHGTCRVQRDLGNGRYVWEILSDYQYAETGTAPTHTANGCDLDGEGYIRLISFGENGKMNQTTYSPLHDDYNFFKEDDDTFEVTLQTKDAAVKLNTETAEIYFEPEAEFNTAVLVIIIGAALIIGVISARIIRKKRKG